MISLLHHESRENGFTLLEMLMVIALLSLLTAGAIALLNGSVDEDRYDQTMEKIRLVRAALIGDPNMSLGGARASFGYVGDMGGLPSTAQGLAALLTAPAGTSAFVVDSANRFGRGWNGPYVKAAVGGQNPLQDAWGRNFSYAVAGGAATVTSFGADGVAGGSGMNQDLVLTINPAQWKGSVYGFLTDGSGSFTGAAQVEIRSSDGNGGFTSSLLSVSAGTQGQFQANDIPYGPRSVVIYRPSRAAATLTRGPFSFVMDRPHFLLTPNLTNFNP